MSVKPYNNDQHHSRPRARELYYRIIWYSASVIIKTTGQQALGFRLVLRCAAGEVARPCACGYASGHVGCARVCVRAAFGVRAGRSYLIGAWRAPTQLRGTSESRQCERGSLRDLDRPQGYPLIAYYAQSFDCRCAFGIGDLLSQAYR